jgi:sporulation integral membrane protein YtvI
MISMKWKINHKTLKIAFLLLIILIAVYLLYLVRVILLPFILAIVLAYLLDPLVSYIEEKGISRTLSILLVYASVITGLFLALFYGLPVIIKELVVFGETVPIYTRQIQDTLKEFYANYQRIEIPESLRQVINENINNLENLLISSLDSMAEKTVGFFSGIIIFLIAPILAFYIMNDKKNIYTKLVSIFSVRWRKEIGLLWKEIDRTLTKFIRGHLLVALIVGLMTTIGLLIINVKFAILLGIIAGLFDLIPYFGPIIGVIPALFVALLDSKSKVLYIILLTIVIQQIEANLLSPKILGESVGLHPLTVIFVVLVGGHLFGFIGLIAAVPITAVVRIIFNYWINKIIS